MEFQEIKDYVHLKSIATKLWESHPFGNVALMVGAGFSRNALHRANENQKMPLWGEVVNKMLESLHPSPESMGDWAKANYHARATHVAQLYETEFGEASLFNLIRDLLRDNEFVPGELHHSLFELPWKDIFTTNYDTLLERAAGTSLRQKYNVIHATADLIGKKSPRIVKLNGSFPSHTPFIITEEHFRTYPKEFAPFVNTVLQSMIESTLVLIGYSGDDPNFQNWTGWIRDNLGGSRLNIYVITGESFSDSKLKLLEKHQIIPIDLRPLIDKGKEDQIHGECLKLFFQFLKNSEPPIIEEIWGNESKIEAYRKKRNLSDTLVPNKIPHPVNRLAQLKKNRPPHNLRDELVSLIQVLEHNRSLYPGWVICPIDVQKSYFDHVERWEWEFENHYSDLDPIDQIRLAYEILWIVRVTYSRTDWGMLNSGISGETVRKIVSSYNPFPSELVTPWVIDGQPVPSINLDTEMKSKWVEMILDIPWVEDQFRDWMERIRPILIYNKNWERKWLYEKAIAERNNLRFKNAIELVQKLDHKIIDAEWMLRIGFVWSDLGNSKRALELFAEGLSQVRLSMITQPESPRLQSLDSMFSNMLGFLQGVSTKNVFNPSLNVRNNSWNTLKEMESAIRSNAPIVRKDKAEVKSFDLNWMTSKGKLQYNFNPKDFLPSHRYICLFLFEGFPFIIFPNEGQYGGMRKSLFVPNVLNWISISSPGTILSLLSLSTDFETCKKVLSRGLIDQLDEIYVDFVIRINLEFLESEIGHSRSDYPAWFSEKLRPRVQQSFFILCRLMLRVRENLLPRVTELAKQVHSEKVLLKYPELKEGLLTIFENLTFLYIENGTISQHISWILDTPSPYYLGKYIHGFQSIDVAKATIYNLEPFGVEVDSGWLSKYVNSLLEEVNSKEKEIQNGAIDRLFQLLTLDYLSEIDKGKFIFLLKRIEHNDLIEDHFHYIPEILNHIDAQDEIKEFVRKKLLNAITTNPNATNLSSVLSKYNRFFLKLFSCIELGTVASKSSLVLEKSIFSEFLGLLPNYISGHNVTTRLKEVGEIEVRNLSDMQTWLFQVIIFYQNEWDGDDISNINKTISLLEDRKIPNILLKLALCNIDKKQNDWQENTTFILHSLFSNRNHYVISAIDAIKYWWKLGQLGLFDPPKDDMICALLRKIESKNDPGISVAISTLIDLTMLESNLFVTDSLKPQINFTLEVLYAELRPLESPTDFFESPTDFWGKISRSPYEFDENLFPFLRFLASQFAYFYSKSFTKLDEPKILDLWRQLSTNDNLPEIRATWRVRK